LEYSEYFEYFFSHSQPGADGIAMAEKEFREFKVFGLFGFSGWPVAAGAFLGRGGQARRNRINRTFVSVPFSQQLGVPGAGRQ